MFLFLKTRDILIRMESFYTLNTQQIIIVIISGIVINILVREKWEVWRNWIAKTMLPNIFQDVAHMEINNICAAYCNTGYLSNWMCRFEAGGPQPGLQVPISPSGWMDQNHGKAWWWKALTQGSWKQKCTKRRVLGTEKQKAQETTVSDRQLWLNCDQSPLCSYWVCSSLYKTLGARCLLENSFPHLKKVIWYLYIPYII